MANKTITKTDTLETLRVTFNGIDDLNIPFEGVPSDLVEAVNTKSDLSYVDTRFDNIPEPDMSLYSTVIAKDQGDTDTLAAAVQHTDNELSAYEPGSPAKGGGSEEIFYLNGTVVNEDYTIPSGMNAMTAGPIEQNATITIPDGSAWVIV